MELERWVGWVGGGGLKAIPRTAFTVKNIAFYKLRKVFF